MSECVNPSTIAALNDLKLDNIRIQKRGLPFIASSVVIWTLIAVVCVMPVSQGAKNLYTFCCSPLLMPLAYLFSRLVKADIFGGKKNPLNSLGFLFTMNQMLYLLIVMWVFNAVPDKMVMIYAMIFGAHLLPFGWLYNSRSYMVVSVISTVVSMVLGLYLGSLAVAVFMVLAELGLVIALCIQNKNL